MFKVRIKTDRAIAGLEHWRRALGDLTSFWSLFAARYLQDVQDNWDQEGGMVGGWAPLSPRYAAWKARRWGQHLGILELSLRLRGSLQWLGRDIGPEGIFRPGPSSVEIGTEVEYGRYHMRGTKRMPARPFLFYTGDAEYEELWRTWIADRAREGGLDVA
jgi:phage gpG-like protein